MNRADLTRRVLLYEQLAEAATAEAATFREELAAAACREYKEEGMAPTWKLPLAGSVVLPISQTAIVVTDEAALTKWVAQVHPEQVYLQEHIRPAYAAALTKSLAIEGDAVFDPDSGEVVPGLGVRHGGQPKTLSIKPTPDAKSIARQHANALLERFTADLNGDGA